MKRKVLVAMSGGVDSTVSAYLLQQDGYEVEGIYMKLKGADTYHEQNLQNIKVVSEYLGIKYHILDLSATFEEKVFDYFVAGYKEGVTPNPCVICNKEIKFGALWNETKRLGFEYLATGHYVKVENGFITEALDDSKDQSYFLAKIDTKVLTHMIFPLGNRLKSDIKEIAKNIEPLRGIAEQKESSEICFVEKSYIDVLSEHMQTTMPGDVVDIEGKIIGEHQGYMHYTIGKRKGFRVFISHVPNYVIDIDAKYNRLIVGPKEQLERSVFRVDEMEIDIDAESFECEVRIRYRSPKTKCRVQREGSGAIVTLEEPAYGIANGQFSVFYDGAHVLGGAIIVPLEG